ncbi:hypothetical protein ACFVHB_14750 [Kitasatospora sp. NPDC127111]|uniref:hypothetical protein n=1 Tax=Kitasatospora sp. NPDC127111 TaxID=3345363 RepID=UPI003629F7E9
MKDRGKEPTSDAVPRRASKPWDEAMGDRSYGDRAAGAEPDPDGTHDDPSDGLAVRERYDATADAARSASGHDDSKAEVTDDEVTDDEVTDEETEPRP